MTDCHSKTRRRPKDRFRPDVTVLTPFKTPGRDKKRVTFWSDPMIFEWIPNRDITNKTSTSPTSSSQSSLRVQHSSPRSPSSSSSPPAQFSPREHLVSPNPEDHTAPKQQKIIQPQDIDKQPTPGLAALVQETSPLAPYKIQRSAKRRARQTLSNMC